MCESKTKKMIQTTSVLIVLEGLLHVLNDHFETDYEKALLYSSPIHNITRIARLQTCEISHFAIWSYSYPNLHGLWVLILLFFHRNDNISCERMKSVWLITIIRTSKNWDQPGQRYWSFLICVLLQTFSSLCVYFFGFASGPCCIPASKQNQHLLARSRRCYTTFLFFQFHVYQPR